MREGWIPRGSSNVDFLVRNDLKVELSQVYMDSILQVY